MRIKHKYFRYSIILFTVCIFVILISNIIINNSSDGKLYSSILKIPNNQVGLVLGCSRYLSDGRLNLFFKNRINAAGLLYKNGKIEYIIVSGDNSNKKYDEPTEMKNALMEQGVPDSVIYCDYAGFRTFDSIIRTKEIFSCDSITIISQEFHNKRAVFIANNMGIEAIGFNAEEVSAYHSFKTKLREQFAKVKTVLDIFILGTEPKFYGQKINIGSTKV